uniref:Uncharacterized protein n=1 Tax=Arundo donax TaxID=35708 RepID=A0A0A9AVP3_ARUDO
MGQYSEIQGVRVRPSLNQVTEGPFRLSLPRLTSSVP